MIIYLIIGIIFTGFVVRVGIDKGLFDEIDFDNIETQIAGIIVIILNIALWPVTVIKILLHK